MTRRRRQRMRRALHAPVTEASTSVTDLQRDLASMLIPVQVTRSWDPQTVFGLQTALYAIRAEAEVVPSEDGGRVVFRPADVLEEIRRLAQISRRLLSGLPPVMPETLGHNVLAYAAMRNMAVPIANQIWLYANVGTFTDELRSSYSRWLSAMDAWSGVLLETIYDVPGLRNAVAEVAASVDLSLDAVASTLMEPLPRPDLTQATAELGSPIGVAIAVGVTIVIVAGVAVAGVYAWNQPEIEEAKVRQLEAEAELESLKVLSEGIRAGMSADELQRVLDPALKFREQRPRNDFPWGWVLGGGAVVLGLGWVLFSESEAAVAIRERFSTVRRMRSPRALPTG